MTTLTRAVIIICCCMLIATSSAQATSGITIDQLLAGKTISGKILTDHNPDEKMGYDLVDLSNEANDHGMMEILQGLVFVPNTEDQELTTPRLTIGLWLSEPLKETDESADDIEQEILTIDLYEGTDCLTITSPAAPVLNGRYVTDASFYTYIDELLVSLQGQFADFDNDDEVMGSLVDPAD